MFSYVKPGPLQLLARWLRDGSRVRVVTRHGRGVRGVSEGLLVAYDRYMNLVLRDVREVYTVIVREPRVKQIPIIRLATTSADVDDVEPGETGEVVAAVVEKVRWCRRQDVRQRTLHQVFVKGDCVVLVSCAATAASSPPPPPQALESVEAAEQHQQATGASLASAGARISTVSSAAAADAAPSTSSSGGGGGASLTSAAVLPPSNVSAVPVPAAARAAASVVPRGYRAVTVSLPCKDDAS